MTKNDLLRIKHINMQYGEQYVEGMWGSYYKEGGHESIKHEYHRLLKKFLREVAKHLKLPNTSYTIHTNPGGIAVSGESTLHGEHIYISLGHGCYNDSAGYFRRCEGRKDYHGGQNHWIGWDELADAEQLADRTDFAVFPFRVIA